MRGERPDGIKKKKGTGGRKWYKWRSQTRFQVNVRSAVRYRPLFNAVRSTWCGGVLFLKSVSHCIKVEPCWEPKSNLWPQILFCDNRFSETCCLFFFLSLSLNFFTNLSENEKSPFRLVSSPLLSSLSARAPPDDACCQGDRYNPGDRPFLWAAPCDWPMDRGRGGSADWAVLIGWLAGLARGRSPGRVSVASIDLIGWQAGRQSAHTHTHTHRHTQKYTTAGGLEVQGEIWPSGGHLCGSERMCV